MPKRRYNRINAFRPHGLAADVARSFHGADRPKKPRNQGGRRGRKLGTKVKYNAYQTSRYQSIWLRTERARRLAPPTMLSAGVWQFRSKRKRVLPYRTTTKDGSLAPITDFTGNVTRSGNPPPATNWNFTNPLFQWTANGIHDYSKDTPGSGGGTIGAAPDDGSSPSPLDWSPVPAGQTRSVLVTVTASNSYTGSADGCAAISGGGEPYTSSSRITLRAASLIYSRSFSGSDPNALAGNVCTGGQAGGTAVTTARLLYIPGLPTLTLSRVMIFTGNPTTAASVYNTQTDKATVTFEFDQAPLPPPSPSPYVPLSDTGFQLPSPNDDGSFPSSTPNLSTAGIVAASNEFSVSERLDIFTSIAYSIAAGMPAPSGSISLKLYGNSVLTAELSETPTGSTGALNRPMTLLPNIDYQFRIGIPESVYCDAAIVRLGGKFLCNCPDFNRKSKAFPSKYPSELGDRDWSASSAGTRHDCKHIIYLKLQTGEPIDAEPDDLKDIRQWHKDQVARQRAARKQQRKAEAQGRRDARKRVRADLRGMKRRDKAELKQLTANREYKKARTQRYLDPLGYHYE